MSVKKRGVGRPPETDGQGKQIAKAHVTLLLPVVLKEFLRRQPNMNMSALLTRVVTMLYVGQICPKCYSDNGIETTHVGTYCKQCSTDHKTMFFIWDDCPSCGVQYSKKNMANNQWDDKTNKPIIGCFDCMGQPKKIEDRLSADPTPVEPLKLMADPKQDNDELVK